MFKKGDVLQNKHYNNLIVRMIGDNKSVTPEGYIDFAPHKDHWEPTSYWRWFKVTFKWIVAQSSWRHEYKTNKDLGMVDTILPDDYWHQFPPVYLDVYKPVVEYGYLKFNRLIKELQLPVWRENNYHASFEEPIGRWFARRLTHLL